MSYGVVEITCSCNFNVKKKNLTMYFTDPIQTVNPRLYLYFFCFVHQLDKKTFTLV